MRSGPQGPPGTAGPPGVAGYEIINTSVLDTASSSRPEGDSGLRVEFKSNGGMGEASVYAICAMAS
jgi:hypothetical protein